MNSGNNLTQLLQVVTRKWRNDNNNRAPPPSAAAAALGQALALAVVQEQEAGEQYRDMDMLYERIVCDPNVHPSIGHAMMDQLSLSPRNVVHLGRWVLSLEQQQHLELIRTTKSDDTHASSDLQSSCHTAFVVATCHAISQHIASSDMSEAAFQSWTHTWHTIQHASTRHALWRKTVARVAFHADNDGDYDDDDDDNRHANSVGISLRFLAPALASLDLSLATWLLLARAVWRIWPSSSAPQQRQWVQWVRVYFGLHWGGMHHQKESNVYDDAQVELEEQMWLDWLDWCAAVTALSQKSQRAALADNSIPLLFGLNDFVPLSLSHSTSVLWAANSLVLDMIEHNQERDTWSIAPHSALKLATDSLVTFDPERRRALLETMTVCCEGSSTISSLIQMLWHAVGVLCQHSPLLLENFPSVRGRKRASVGSAGLDGQVEHQLFAQLLGLVKDEAMQSDSPSDTAAMCMRRIIANTDTFENTSFSARQQITAMLFGVAYLDADTIDSTSGSRLQSYESSDDEDAFKFLRRLLDSYPSLGVSLLPIILDRIRRTTDGNHMLQLLDFLCTSLVRDPHSASQVWNWVGIQWMQPHVSLTLRVSLLRLYPKVVAANSRMYRRVLAVVGASLAGGSENPSILRLAAAATLAEMAAQNLFHDVTDVVGWIQALLVTDLQQQHDFPTHALLVHYAILSLHFLVVAGELDFDVVVKVLNKKLCSVADHSQIMKLPLVVLEALVMLLGDGGHMNSESSDENDEEKDHKYQKPISPQITASIKALIHISTSINSKAYSDTDEAARSVELRIRSNVIFSLSNYTLRTLGVDEDTITSSVAFVSPDNSYGVMRVSNAYTQLRDLVVHEMKSLPTENDVDNTCPLKELVADLVEYEEEIVGASLWQKRGKNTTPGTSTRDSSDVGPVSHHRKLLPQPSYVMSSLNINDSVTNSIAHLFCSDSKSRLVTLRDHADSCLEVANDPLLFILSIQGYLTVSSQLVSAQSESVDDLLTEINSWHEIRASPDAVCLALSCLSIFIPANLSEDPGGVLFVDEIYSTVMLVFQSMDFEKEEIGKLCIGLLGISCIRYESTKRMNDLIDLLEQSLRGYGGEQTFCAYYGISLIADACANYARGPCSSKVSSLDCMDLVIRSTSLVLEELVFCIEDANDYAALGTLIRDTQNGTVSPALLEAVQNLGHATITILPAKKTAARSILYSCAVCFPALASVDKQLVLAMYYLLESLDWGYGKGVALTSTIRACRAAGVLDDESLDQAHVQYVAEYKNFYTSQNASGEIEDVYFCLRGIHWNTDISLPNEIDISVDQNSRALSVVALTASIAVLPCLGVAPVGSAIRLYNLCSENEIDSVVKNISKAADAKDIGVDCSVAKIMLAVLSSIDDIEIDILPKKDGIDTAIDTHPDVKHMAWIDTSEVAFDFTSLPTPKPGTVLSGILNMIESSCSFGKEREELLGRALLSLNKVSLPDQYAKSFLEVLIEKGWIRKTCIQLVCAQVHLRRRSFQPGKSFHNLVKELCLATPDRWTDLFVDDELLISFVDQLFLFIPKLSPDVVKACISNIWEKFQMTQATKFVPSFLTSIRKLLSNTSMAPVSLAVLREFTQTDVFDFLSKARLSTVLFRSATVPESILDLYAQCLSLIPRLALLQFSEAIDTFQATEPLRAIVTLQLIKSGYFTTAHREAKETTNVAAWLSKTLLKWPGNEYSEVFLRVECIFASTVSNTPSKPRRDRISLLFEVLLLTDAKSYRLVLQWLAINLAFWYGTEDAREYDICSAFFGKAGGIHLHSFPSLELECVLGSVMERLPSNLASYARLESQAANVSNQLFRILKHLKTLGSMDTVKSVELIQRAIQACHERRSSSHHQAHIDLTTKLLTNII